MMQQSIINFQTGSPGFLCRGIAFDAGLHSDNIGTAEFLPELNRLFDNRQNCFRWPKDVDDIYFFFQLAGNRKETAVCRFAQDFIRARIDRNNPITLCLQIAGDVIGGFSRVLGTADYGNRLILFEDFFGFQKNSLKLSA